MDKLFYTITSVKIKRYILLVFTLLACSQKQHDENQKYDTIAIVLDSLSSSASSAEEYIPAISDLLWDSIYNYELNTYEGKLKEHLPTQPTDTIVKLFIYEWGFYEQSNSEDGAVWMGIFEGPIRNDLMFHRLAPITFSYDSSAMQIQPPYIENSKEQPLFLLKGLKIDQVKGKDLTKSTRYFIPGDSITIGLGDATYKLFVKGRKEGNIIRDYRIMLTLSTGNRVEGVVLLGRRYMPLPNVSDIIPDFIFWVGDLNNDGFMDLITGRGMKVCVDYILWMGAPELNFRKVSSFTGCSC